MMGFSSSLDSAHLLQYKLRSFGQVHNTIAGTTWNAAKCNAPDPVSECIFHKIFTDYQKGELAKESLHHTSEALERVTELHCKFPKHVVEARFDNAQTLLWGAKNAASAPEKARLCLWAAQELMAALYPNNDSVEEIFEGDGDLDEAIMEFTPSWGYERRGKVLEELEYKKRAEEARRRREREEREQKEEEARRRKQRRPSGPSPF